MYVMIHGTNIVIMPLLLKRIVGAGGGWWGGGIGEITLLHVPEMRAEMIGPVAELQRENFVHSLREFFAGGRVEVVPRGLATYEYDI